VASPAKAPGPPYLTVACWTSPLHMLTVLDGPDHRKETIETCQRMVNHYKAGSRFPATNSRHTKKTISHLLHLCHEINLDCCGLCRHCSFPRRGYSLDILSNWLRDKAIHEIDEQDPDVNQVIHVDVQSQGHGSHHTHEHYHSIQHNRDGNHHFDEYCDRDIIAGIRTA